MNQWDERRRALEEEFFAKLNRELVQKLQAKEQHERDIAELEQAIGIKDHQVLDELVRLGVTPSTALALSLVPLITVAWAGHKMDAKERDAILKAAGEHGITHGSTASDLLQSWLNQKPEESLFQTWTLYIQGLKEALDPASFASLQNQILGRAHTVAAATGGVLGLGSKVSDLEKKQLDRLTHVFSN